MLRRPNFTVIAYATATIATGLLWTLVSVDLSRRQQGEFRAAETNASNLAKAYAGQVHGLLFALDEFIQGVRADYVQDPAGFRVGDWAAREYGIARELVTNLSVADATGLVLQSSANPSGLKNVSIADREHFRVHAEAPGTDRLFISKPLVGRVSLKPSIQVTRPVLNAEGRFDGVVVASINPEELSRFYGTIDVGKRGAVTLVGDDGFVRARAPTPAKATGAAFPQLEHASGQDAAASACATAVDPIDGVGRLSCSARVEGLPFSVSVGLGAEEILADYAQTRAQWTVGATLMTAAIWAAAMALAARERQREETARATEDGRARLAEESARLEATLDNISQGIMMIGPDRTLKVLNARVREMLDLPEAVAHTGATIDSLIDWQWRNGEFGPDGALLDPALRDYVLSGGLQSTPEAHLRRRPNGEHLDIRTNPLPGGGIVRTYANVTELMRAKDAAEAGDRAKTSFLATMSHEIRTPMNGVVGMISMLESTPLSDEQARYVETIKHSGEALVALIDDILDFSKLDAGQVEIERREYSPVAVAESVLDILEPTAARKRVALMMSVGPGADGTFLGDPTRVRQVLLNLCGNAVKFTEQGSVVLRLSTRQEGATASRLKFEVVDTGIGIADAMRPKLFREFSQADASVTRKYGGTGLGLAISKRMVAAMGGTIDYASEPGVGSTFWFETPSAAVSRPERPPPVATATIETADARTRASLRSLLPLAGLAERVDAPGEFVLIDAAALDAEAAAGRARGSTTIAFGIDARRLEASVHRVAEGALTPRWLERAVSGPIESAGTKPLLDEPAPGPAHVLNVLVAEDYPANQDVLRGILAKLGHRSTVVRNGREALEALCAEPFDAVLMDVQMSEMDGLEATRRIRALPGPEARVRIIAMTASALPSDREACLAAGMNGYVSKPIDRRKVAVALEGGVAAS